MTAAVITISDSAFAGVRADKSGPAVRERLEDTARELSQALTRAGDAVKQIRVADVAEIMRRSPLAALAVAAGIGLVAGIMLWSREK